MERIAIRAADGVELDAVIHPAVGPPSATVVQAHGITVDMDEGGMFVRLADRLAAVGFTVLRFSYRGHGHSSGGQRGVTIAGELLDFQAALDVAAVRAPGRMSVVAASFGAVSACLSLPYVEGQLDSLVLWNPVLDLRRTFVEPELPWGEQNYGPGQQELLKSRGCLTVDGEFELGRVLFEEFRLYDPEHAFRSSSTPALIVHGDHDTAVSYKIAHEAAEQRGNCAFHTVSGSDHGFDSREREDEAIRATVDWLAARHAERS